MKITIVDEAGSNLESPDFVEVKIEDIDKVEDASCKVVRLGRVLDRCSLTRRFAVIEALVKKLRYGGYIKMEGLDYFVLSKSVVLGTCDIVKYNELVDGCKSFATMQTTIDILESLGLNVDSVNYLSLNTDIYECPFYAIEARREKNGS